MDIHRIVKFYKLISHNQQLANNRHPMFERNLAMKVFGYVFVGFWAVYLLFFGVTFYFIFSESSIEPYDMINGGAIFFLAIDFFLRFGMQETPAQEIRPYKLLPIPITFLLNVFMIRIGLKVYNLFWHFFFVPFGLLSIPFYHGFGGLLGFLLGWWLLFVFNAYWYLIWRSLINKHILNLFFPLAVYGALFYFGYFHNEEQQWLFTFFMHLGQGFIAFNPAPFLTVLLAIAFLFVVNNKIQGSMVYTEIAKIDGNTKVRSSEMAYLNKFGIIGQYIKLEMKSTMRNLVVRKQFIIGVSCMILISLIFAFTDVYDDSIFMRSYICVYCFACLGVMTLTGIMCAEGNYMDGLMSRKESVLSLLKAKYYFNCMVIIIPVLIFMMPILAGKITLLEAVGSLFFTTGVIFPFLFQLAVYNNTTLHLNEKITKSGRSTKVQTIVSLVALFVPMFIMYILITISSISVASSIMFFIGLLGTLLHPMWLRNIYNRFMKRRYINMQGFRDTIHC